MGGAKKIAKKASKTISKVPGGSVLQKLTPGLAAAQAFGDGKNPLSAAIDPLNITGANPPAAQLGSMNYGYDENGRPISPDYESLRGPTGELQGQYKYDPAKSAAFAKLQEQAMAAPGESPWAKMQMQKQAMEQQDAVAQAAKQGATAQQQAMSALMRQGGLGSGARTSLAKSSARDAMLAQQNVARQGISQRLGIGESDINRQQDLLGRVSSTELEGQGKNLQTLMGDVRGKQEFDINKYRDQMQAWGANKTANAQVAAANRSSKK